MLLAANAILSPPIFIIVVVVVVVVGLGLNNDQHFNT